MPSVFFYIRIGKTPFFRIHTASCLCAFTSRYIFLSCKLSFSPYISAGFFKGYTKIMQTRSQAHVWRFAAFLNSLMKVLMNVKKCPYGLMWPNVRF